MFHSLTSFVDSSNAGEIFNIDACRRLANNFEKLPIVIPRISPYDEVMQLGMAMRYAMIYVVAGEAGLNSNQIVPSALTLFRKGQVGNKLWKAFFDMAEKDKLVRGGNGYEEPSQMTKNDFIQLYKLMWDFYQSPKLYFEKCADCDTASQIFHQKAASCVKCGAPLPNKNVVTVESPIKLFQYSHPSFDYNTIVGGEDFGADYPIAVNGYIVSIRTVKTVDWKNIAMLVGWWALSELCRQKREGGMIYYSRHQTQITLTAKDMKGFLIPGWRKSLAGLRNQRASRRDYLGFDDLFEHDDWGD